MEQRKGCINLLAQSQIARKASTAHEDHMSFLSDLMTTSEWSKLTSIPEIQKVEDIR